MISFEAQHPASQLMAATPEIRDAPATCDPASATGTVPAT